MLPIKSTVLPMLEQFLGGLESPATRAAYQIDLFVFRKYLGEIDADLNHLTFIVGIQYKGWLSLRYSKPNANRKISAAKSYLNFAFKCGEIALHGFNAVSLFKNNDYELTPGISNEETVKILEAAQDNKMHSAILHWLFFLGLRRAEVCSIRLSDLNLNTGVPTASILGKGNKRRQIPIPEPVIVATQRYLDTKHNLHNDYPLFFRAEKNKIIRPLHHNSITNIVHTYSMQAIGRKISPHSARVTCVSNALENGAQIQTVQYLGGWSDLTMVQRYDRRRHSIVNSAAWKVNYGGKK